MLSPGFKMDHVTNMTLTQQALRGLISLLNFKIIVLMAAKNVMYTDRETGTIPFIKI